MKEPIAKAAHSQMTADVTTHARASIKNLPPSIGGRELVFRTGASRIQCQQNQVQPLKMFCALFLCVVVATLGSAWTYPAGDTFSRNQRAKRSVDVDNPEDVIRVLMKLAQDVVDSDSILRSEKRGIDLGLSRGFSGQQAAKHLMGLAAANFANGPGRRRRNADD